MGPSRLSHHTRSRSCSFSSVSNKKKARGQRKNEWTYHLQDIQRHVGQAADVKTIKAQEKAGIKKTSHKAESSTVAKDTEYKAHDTFMREGTLVQIYQSFVDEFGCCRDHASRARCGATLLHRSV